MKRSKLSAGSRRVRRRTYRTSRNRTVMPDWISLPRAANRGHPERVEFTGLRLKHAGMTTSRHCAAVNHTARVVRKRGGLSGGTRSRSLSAGTRSRSARFSSVHLGGAEGQFLTRQKRVFGGNFVELDQLLERNGVPAADAVERVAFLHDVDLCAGTFF